MIHQTAGTDRRITSKAAIRRVVAVVNSAAGGVGPGAAEALQALLDEFGLDSRVIAPPPEDIAVALRSAVESRPDLIVVLAGDGTAGLAADLCGPDGPLLAPLPGGTMNMLPRALYGNQPWRECLIAALGEGQGRMISGGELGGRKFYCAAILGSPALWAPAREAMRLWDLKAAWRHAAYAFRRAFTSHLRFEVGGKRRKAVALGLICPLVSRVLDREQALEAAFLNVQDAAQAFHLGLTNAFRDWREDPAVTVQHCIQGRAWARRPIPCLLDGEMHRLGRSIDFRFVPRGFRALAPAPPAKT
jgi:diacylglycerol kinase family enzyme